MIWTISDLHLSTVQPKPMDIFGDRWRNHADRIAAAWRERVRPDDVVLIAGDISWAMKLEDALPDLAWIAALPGRKVLCRGNHDYWWSAERTNRVRRMVPESLTLLQSDAVDVGDAVVCGTRGWVSPDMPGFDEATDQKIYTRELGRLDQALKAGRKLAGAERPLIVMIHFPPFVNRQPTEFARRMTEADVTTCVYGHLHRPEDWAAATQGRVNGVFYQLTACDYLGFGPVGVRGIGE